MRRLMFVFAHPDDETMATGATIAHYSQNNEIHLICATKGEAGNTGKPPQCHIEELAVVREQELRAAAKHLGISSIHFLNYQDGKLNQTPEEQLARDIVKSMELINPEVVVTFAPHGISGHKDHMAIQRATFKAVLSLQGSSVKKLYYITLPSSIIHHKTARIHTDPDETITTIIDAPGTLPKLVKAILEHKTQNQSIKTLYRGIYEGDYSHVKTKNHYILAWHAPDLPLLLPETDLLAGLT